MTIDGRPTPAPLALVAGGSRGLGLLIARELGDRGHRLVVCARNAEELAGAREMLTERGHDVTVAVCDVTDADAVEALVSEVEDSQGPIEVLVTVAGVIQVGPLEAMNRSHFAEAIDIMVWGPINTTLPVAARMKQRRRGRIGIITSIAGLVPVPHLVPYSTAKFGAVGFSGGLRSELAGSGVTVTTVAPGLMRTGSHLHAKFVGNQGAEYGWFGASASLPGMTMDAERAATKIVDGVLAGRSVLLLSWVTKVAARVNGLAPRTTAAALGLAARLLPKSSPSSTGETVTGFVAHERLNPRRARLMDRLTTLNRYAADRFNQRTSRD